MIHRKADVGRSKTEPATEQMAHFERTLEASIALMKRARRAMLRSRRQQPRDVTVEIRDERVQPATNARREWTGTNVFCRSGGTRARSHATARPLRFCTEHRPDDDDGLEFAGALALV